MKAIEVAQKLAEGGRVHELTGIERGQSANRVYRIWLGERTRIAKIYGTPARERRESHALRRCSRLKVPLSSSIAALKAMLHWAIFEDAGRWNLGTLPENPGLARKAGEILRTVHETASEKITNLSRGMDQEWVAVDFLSTLRRLERYRRRLELPSQLTSEDAREVRPPFASDPRSAHTNPAPDNFVVDDDGNVTLINWEWATVAPVEWDLSKASWLLGLACWAARSCSAFQEGYGRTMDQYQLDRWIVYHTAMTLVFRVERAMDAAIGTHDMFLSEFRRSVAASTLNAENL